MIINGEMAAKPRFYFRNDLLHVRYNVDRAVELTKEVNIYDGWIHRAQNAHKLITSINLNGA